jgi:hypothetical protein
MTVSSQRLSRSRELAGWNSVRWDADQAVEDGQQSMAELLQPGGYIVPGASAVPFARSAAGLATGYRNSVLVSGPARKDAEQAEDA